MDTRSACWTLVVIDYSYRFPSYDEQPETSSNDPPSVWNSSAGQVTSETQTCTPQAYYPAEAYLKTPLWQTSLSGRSLAKTGFPRTTYRKFSQFIAKARLDNKAAIWYLNLLACMIMVQHTSLKNIALRPGVSFSHFMTHLLVRI